MIFWFYTFSCSDPPETRSTPKVSLKEEKMMVNILLFFLRWLNMLVLPR